MADSQDMLKQVPNNVSGDGKNFVAALKKCLKALAGDAERIIKQIGEGTVEQVTGLRLSVTHSTNENGPQTNIVVEFDTTNVADYSFAQIWMKEHNNNLWQQKGNCQGVKYIIENVVVPKTYDVKVVACNKNAGYADFDNAPTASIEAKGSQYICNSPSQFYWNATNHRWEWSGYVDNGYTDFFEIRLDQKPGVWNDNRLDAIEPTKSYSTVMPPVRSGTAYLYVRNIFGQYNSPISHQYTISAPAKPAKPTLTKTTDGVSVTLQALPTGCRNYVVDVDGVEYEIYSSPWTVYQFFGEVTIKYCFVDDTGRGPWSDSASLATGRKIVKTEITDGAIDTPQLAANAITAGKLNVNDINSSSILANAIQGDRIKAGTLDANKITAGTLTIRSVKDENGNAITEGNGVVTIKDGAIRGESIQSKTIVTDHISANGISGSVIQAGTLDAQAIKTDQLSVGSKGSPLWIANGAITASKIATGAITADKIDITNGTTGAKVVISSNLIEVYDGTHDFPRVRLGVWP